MIRFSRLALLLPRSLFVTLFFGVTYTLDQRNFHLLPGLHEESYSQLGDINVGALTDVVPVSGLQPAGACSKDVAKSTYPVEGAEAIAFAVDLVNQNPHILPNVSLGYVVRGICMSTGVTIGTSLSFLPRTSSCNSSMCSTADARSDVDSTWLSYDVIGVIGAGWSSLAVPVSSLYAVSHLPMVGAAETSDELSNKRNHPYFFRTVPPDMYQVQAILSFIAANGWSYISVLYEDGSYGQKAFDRIHQNVDSYGICVATSHRLIHPPKYDEIVSDLLLNYRARVVVLFVWRTSFRDILQAVVDQNATGHFIWVGADSLAYYRGYQYKGVDHDPAVGTFAFDIHASFVQDFFDYIEQQKVSTTTNPWMKSVWEYLFDCSYDKGTCDLDANMLQSTKYYAYRETSLRIDAVLALAQAAHDLLSIRCPHARGQKARDCITGELLREYLKNTTFEGFNGHMEFDKNQDIKGKYIISQLVEDYFRQPFKTNVTGKKMTLRTQVGIYDISTDTLTKSDESISWSHLTQHSRWNDYFDLGDAPQSKCSNPCKVGEYKIEKELPCCWECRTCRDNERLINDNTTCEQCPSFMWPDGVSGFTTCIDIPPTFPMFKDPIPIVFTTLAIFALIVTLFIILSYAIYRNERVIKASSKELSVIQLVAIFVGYATLILFQIKPSDTICTCIFFSFCMSFALLYCPLLVKTIRICRIFRSGTKNEKPRFINPRSQLIFATSLIALQVGLCIAIYILYSPKAQLTQPIWSEKLVELSCDLTFAGISSFLGYNIVLVSLCSVFAFMVRKLPDNFNESKFISMCVTTTLLIFLAFIPAYFTADRQFVRSFLLSVALFLNHSVALIFLFIPKIYAARFLPSETGDFSKNRS